MNMKSLIPYLVALGIGITALACDGRAIGQDNTNNNRPDAGQVDSGTPDAYSPLTATLNVLPNPTRGGDLTQFECIAEGGVPPYESFEIDFGDGEAANTDYAQHAFTYEESLEASCTVRDSEGNTATANADVEVLCGCVDVDYALTGVTTGTRTACLDEDGVTISDAIFGGEIHVQEPANDHFYGQTNEFFVLQKAGIPNIRLLRYYGVDANNMTARFETLGFPGLSDHQLTLANGVYTGVLNSGGYAYDFEIDPTTLDIKMDLNGDGLYTGGNTDFAEGTCLRP